MDVQKELKTTTKDNQDKKESNVTTLEGELIDAEVVVKLEDNKSKSQPFNALNLFTVFKLGANVKDIIKPNQEYIVKFPAALAEKMKVHDLDFLKESLTGDMLPILYDHTKKEIAGYIRLEPRKNVSPQQWKNLGDSISQAIEQARFDNLENQLNQIHYNVQKIQQGQDNDRFAEILTGIELLNDAKFSEGEVNRIKSAHSAILSLKNGTNKIKLALISELNNFPDIKDSLVSRVWFTVRNSENRSQLRASYNTIQYYFENYYKGLLPLAEAYSLIGEPDRIEDLIESTSEILHHPNLVRLNKVEKLLPIGYDYSINWYKNPNKIEQRIRDSFTVENVISKDLFKLTGQEILALQERG